MRYARAVAVLAGLAGLGTALPALAHPGHALESGFTAGLLHPLSGLDHLLALLAVALWSRWQRHGIVLPPVLLVLMALGASMAPLLPAMPALETSIAATVLLLGVLAACALRVPDVLSIAAVGLCGFLHGLAHGRELAGMGSGAGFLLASAALMALGALPGARMRRVAGAAIGAAGAVLLAQVG